MPTMRGEVKNLFNYFSTSFLTALHFAGSVVAMSKSKPGTATYSIGEDLEKHVQRTSKQLKIPSLSEVVRRALKIGLPLLIAEEKARQS